jgi:hypothetical protein
MPYRSAILLAIESLRDLETGSPVSSIRRHIQTASSTATDDHSSSKWNENLFQETLKSLVRQGELLHLGGNYKFTEKHLKERAETLRARADSYQEHLIKIHSAAAPPVPRVHGAHCPHEEDDSSSSLPKESPKRKTVHAKVKIGEAKVITVVNPEKKRGEGEMEVEEVDGMPLDGGGKEDRGKKHVKIIPRKVGVKKM